MTSRVAGAGTLEDRPTVAPFPPAIAQVPAVVSSEHVAAPRASASVATPPAPKTINGAALVLILVVLILFTVARVLGGKPPGELTRRQRRRIARDRLAQSVRTEGDTHVPA